MSRQVDCFHNKYLFYLQYPKCLNYKLYFDFIEFQTQLQKNKQTKNKSKYIKV